MISISIADTPMSLKFSEARIVWKIEQGLFDLMHIPSGSVRMSLRCSSIPDRRSDTFLGGSGGDCTRNDGPTDQLDNSRT
jgi:hypothetical protein